VPLRPRTARRARPCGARRRLPRGDRASRPRSRCRPWPGPGRGPGHGPRRQPRTPGSSLRSSRDRPVPRRRCTQAGLGTALATAQAAARPFHIWSVSIMERDDPRTGSGKHAVSPARQARLWTSGRALTGVAALLAVWLGLTAPSISPVAPPASETSTASTLTATSTGAVVAPPQPVARTQLAPPDARGPARAGGR
jgi:hypothetical protein